MLVYFLLYHCAFHDKPFDVDILPMNFFPRLRNYLADIVMDFIQRLLPFGSVVNLGMNFLEHFHKLEILVELLNELTSFGGAVFIELRKVFKSISENLRRLGFHELVELVP